MNKLDGNEIKVLAALGLIITTIIWGSAFVVMKNSVTIIPPTYLLALRFTIASVALIVVSFKRLRTIHKTDIICGAILGAFLFISYLFQTYGLFYTTASKNAFITTLYVIFVPFLHWFFNKKKPVKNHIIASIIAVFGLALLSLEGDMSVNIGDMLTFVCGLFFACHIVFVERYTIDHDPVVLTVIQMVVAALFSWCVAPCIEGTFSFGVIDFSMGVNLLYLGIFSTMICFLLQNISQKYVSPNTTSILLSFEAVFGLVFALIFLGEVVTSREMVGCGLMFVSVILSEYKKKRKKIAIPKNK